MRRRAAAILSGAILVGGLALTPAANAGTPVELDVVGSNVEYVFVDAGDPVGCTGELIAEVVYGNLSFIAANPIVTMPSPGVVQVDTNNAQRVVVYVALNTGFAPIDFAVCVGP